MKNKISALIIVDIQNDFCEGGALAVNNASKIIPIVNNLIKLNKFDLIVATQDWHPANHKSFASNHKDKNIYDVIDLNGITQVLWPDHCVQNSIGAKFHDNLQLPKDCRVFKKGTNSNVDSYSGFFDNDHKSSTGLGEYLRSKNINVVYIVGLATDYCVKFTALDAVKEGFETVVICDAVKAVNVNSNDEQMAFNEMKKNGISLIESNEIK